MGKFFKSIFGFVAKIFSRDSTDIIKTAVAAALPVVKEVAARTAIETDDALIAAYEHYGATGELDLAQARSVLKRDLVKFVLRRLPQFGGVAGYLLNAAIELAYAEFVESEKGSM